MVTRDTDDIQIGLEPIIVKAKRWVCEDSLYLSVLLSMFDIFCTVEFCVFFEGHKNARTTASTALFPISQNHSALQLKDCGDECNAGGRFQASEPAELGGDGQHQGWHWYLLPVPLEHSSSVKSWG